jgi:threonyl-tRNA synthetase
MHDHRKLGRELGLFDTDPLIGAGLPFWLPAGAAVRHALEEYLRELERRAGYSHVYSPVLGKRELYEISGHWSHYRDGMYPPMEAGGEQVVLRPSLCPHHALLYRSRGRSYRELPLRLAELGGQYRTELSGVLGGLTRVRAMQLNDAHIFCTPDQAAAEARAALAMIRQAYAALGIEPARYRLSLPGRPVRHRQPGTAGKYVGDPRIWDQAARCWPGYSTTRACPGRWARARRRSTGRRSTCRWPTPPSGRRPCLPSRSTSTSRTGSACSTPARTGAGTARSWCTAASSAAWSGRSRT